MSENIPALIWDEGKYAFQRKLGNFVQYFQVNLPVNAYGNPLQIINPMVIAENMLDCETTDDVPDEVVENAVMTIEFDQGMPLIEGLPIWERFEGELVPYYDLFKQYREMLYTGGSRATAKLAALHNIPGRSLQTLSKMHHWQLRCKAYDEFKKSEFQRNREFEIQKLETVHTKAADFLLEKAVKYLEDHPEQLNPKIALEMIKTAMKAGRLALGLSGEKAEGGGSSTNISIHQSSGSGEMSTTVQVGSEQQQDTAYLQSIVHILDQSGALDKAKRDAIDADFEEVVVPEANDGSEAV